MRRSRGRWILLSRMSRRRLGFRWNTVRPFLRPFQTQNVAICLRPSPSELAVTDPSKRIAPVLEQDRSNDIREGAHLECNSTASGWSVVTLLDA